ncbi:MAG: HDOD domain-containing protein [Planctomycetota bacterium]
MKVRAELSAREIEELHLALSRRLGDTSVPTLPQVAMKVVEMVSSEEATINDFTKAIQTDQALSGRLLRMANSAFYAQRQPVTRIDRAMVLMGLDKLKALALGFHLSSALLQSDDGFSFKHQWTQSLFRAWFAHKLAVNFSKEHAGEAFLVGLLSDAGTPLMPVLVGEKYYEMVRPSDAPSDRYRQEWSELMFTHVDVAVALCRLWKLPDVLSLPISMHHQRPQGQSLDGATDTQVLHAIAYIAGSMAIDPDIPTDSIAPDVECMERLFEFNKAQTKELIAEVEVDFRASKEVFDGVIDPSMRVEDIVERANAFLIDSVEDLVEEIAVTKNGMPQLTYEASGLKYEVESQDKGVVLVYISESTGNRLVTETIKPGKQTREDILNVLMLQDSPDDERDPIIECVNRFAA